MISSALSDRFALTTGALCRAVAASFAQGVMRAAMIVLVWGRVRRTERAFLALLARVRSGLHGGGRHRGGCVGPAVPGDLASACDDASRCAALAPSGGRAGRLPLRFGWLMAMMPGEAACFGSQLRTLLAEPEMAALVRDVAQARRILGPMCRMLGVELQVWPERVAVPRKVAPRVRTPVDFGRIPLPRGVLAAAKRQGFGKRF